MLIPGKITNLIAALSVIMTLFSIPSIAKSQTMKDFIDQAADHGVRIFEHTRKMFQNSGREDLVRVINGLEFNIDTDSPIPNAYAQSSSSGERKIIVNAQLILLKYYFSEMGILNLQHQGRWSRCILQYSAYVRDTYGSILAEMLQGGAPALIQPPEDYATQYRGSCDGLHSYFPFSDGMKPQRDASVSNALGFLILHEIGHHYHGHRSSIIEHLDLNISSDMRRFLQEMCFAHDQELQADEFAANTIVDLGVWRAAIDQTVWMVMMATGGLDPDFERGSTHPSPSRREAIVLDAVRTRMASKGTPVPQNMSELIDEMIAFQEKVDEQLPLTKIPGTEGISCR